MSYKEENENGVFEDRVRKAAAALYRVTDTLSDNEPMKWKLRNDALELADALVAMGQKESIFSESFYYPLFICERLLSKISIAAVGGYIAKINFQVLEREYTDISDKIFSFMSLIDKEQILSDISIGHNKRHIKDIRDIIKDTEHVPWVSSVKVPPHMEKTAGKKAILGPSSISERQERITQALQGKGWLHVPEVTVLCGQGASTKTIQRDLGLLVQNGYVQSKGERRWRTYALREENHKEPIT